MSRKTIIEEMTPIMEDENKQSINLKDIITNVLLYINQLRI